MRIRPEGPADHDAIAAVVEAAFQSPVEARLVTAIRASTEYVPELALVAEIDGRVAGHVMISRAWVRDGELDRAVAALSPLAVAPDRHGQGIGSALVREVTRCADERGVPVVVLQGDPRYYSRFGFEHSVVRGIHMELPSWAPSEGGQVLRLSRYDPAIRGVVVLSAAFDTLEERH